MKLLSLTIALSALMVFSTKAKAEDHPSDKVQILMGTRGSSNCTVGPQLPHGSICPSPQTPHGGHGAYKENQPVRGFGQLHVSGTGWGRYGQLLLSPQRGFTAIEDAHDSEKSEEVIRPYYYKVRLDRYNIVTEIAPAAHTAAYRITYDTNAKSKGEATLLFDVEHSLSQHIASEQNGQFLGGNLSYDAASKTLCGFGEYRGGFGSELPYKVFFAIASADFDLSKAIIQQQSGHYAKILPLYDNGKPKVLYIAVSMKSIDNARHFLKEESKASFDEIKQTAQNTWDKALNKIHIEADEHEQELFYTTMYHSMLMPRDRSNDNPRFDGENIDDHYCVWDTWRTAYPLHTLLDEPFVSKTIRSFLRRYEHDGKCTPTFTSSLEWDWRQGGDDVENVIADAFVKGVKDFDRKEAYKWLKWSATHNRSKEYQRLGWQPEVDTAMSCSNALEYAYNDYCVYQVAKMMKDKAFARQMLERSHSWQKLFNAQLKDDESNIRGFIAPRRENGEWCTERNEQPFSPRHGYASWVEFFYEGNSWTYSVFMPHDFDALIALSGGKEKMIEHLQYGFDKGLIALWNEPGFLSPFAFHHCGRPDLTAKYVNMLREKNFSVERGYCDNEDSGAMSSWYIFTTLGFFPNAGQDFYYLLPPAYPKATMHLTNGHTLTITRQGNGSQIKEIRFRGKKLQGYTIRHQQLMKGGELVFVTE